MPTKENFKTLSRTRYKEAKTLYTNGLYDGAYYLSGYVLECALKARICKLLDSKYPEKGDEMGRAYKTHNFDVLIKLAGLEKKLAVKMRSTRFAANWSLITDTNRGWKETARYDVIGTKSKQDILDLFKALSDRKNGALTWVRKTW